jgi:membrane-associated phospholipid phosphatase
VKPRSLLVALAALAPMLVGTEALASDAAATPRTELRHDISEDLFVTGTGAFVSLLFQLDLNKALVPKNCRLCEPPGFDKSARDTLRWNDTKSAEVAGGATAFVVSPALAFGLTGWAAVHDGRGDEFWVNNLLITEATLTTIAITQTAKPIFGRARPAIYYRSGDWKSYAEQERNVSFFSGHSSLAFSLAVSSGTIASLRGYRLAPMVWGVGLPVAAFAAYSRVAADAHYASDVLVGSLVGAGIGFAMPYFLHPPENAREGVAWMPTLIPVDGGAALGATGAF